MQKTDTFIINGMAGLVDRIRDTRAYNLLLKCFAGKISGQSARSWYAGSRTPAGATIYTVCMYVYIYIYIYIYIQTIFIIIIHIKI